MSARPTYRTIDAATCPEGKLEVGGPGSRCGTVGRSRSMTNVVVTKVVTSITSAPTRNAMCAQWRPIARTTTATAATPTTAMVSPSMEPHSVIASNVASRWTKNQRSSAWSHRPTGPSSRTLVRSRPSATRIAVITT